MDALQNHQRRYLFITVFMSGMCVLALELSASRLLGKAFGTGNTVWASVIGLTLLFLTLGYFLGGWLADRFPNQRTFYTVICWGAFAGGAIPFLAMPLLPAVVRLVAPTEQVVLLGSVATMFILLAAPVTLLGTVAPFAVRLAIDTTDHAGRVAGALYAVSTIGSILGSLLPSLVFISAVGTNLTILLFSALLLTTGLIGLLISARQRAFHLSWMPVVLALLAVFVL
ncbi:MAG: hypothetical protein GYB64_01270 [Chloroflexi bacterium]|nr:hypothetical protein [Chloroflexota bacterium]